MVLREIFGETTAACANIMVRNPPPAPGAAAHRRAQCLTTRSSRLMREPLTSTRDARRAALRAAARISASASANHSPPSPKASTARTLCGPSANSRCDAAVARIARRCRHGCRRRARRARPSRRAPARPVPRSDAQHVETGAHRARIGVVGIVDDPAAAQPRLQLQPSGNRAKLRQSRGDVVERRARGGRRRRRGQRIRDVVRARRRSGSPRSRRAGRPARSAVTNSPCSTPLQCALSRREVRRVADAEGHARGAQPAAPRQ